MDDLPDKVLQKLANDTAVVVDRLVDSVPPEASMAAAITGLIWVYVGACQSVGIPREAAADMVRTSAKWMMDGQTRH